MVKKIVKDPLFLAQKLLDATEKDKQVVTDLLDTLRANLDHCNGRAAALACYYSRCFNRSSSNAHGIDYVNDHYDVILQYEQMKCEFTERNEQCIKERCPFHK